MQDSGFLSQAEQELNTLNALGDETFDPQEQAVYSRLLSAYQNNKDQFSQVVHSYLEGRMAQNLNMANIGDKEVFERNFTANLQAKMEALMQAHETRKQELLRDIKDQFVFLKEQIAGKEVKKTAERPSEILNTAEYLNSREADRNSPFIFVNANPEVVKNDWISSIGAGTFVKLFAGGVMTVSAIGSMSEHSLPIAGGAFLMFNGVKNDMFPPKNPNILSPDGKKKIDKMADDYGVEKEFMASLFDPKAVAWYEIFLGKNEGTRANTKHQKILNREFMNAINFDSFQTALSNTESQHGCWKDLKSDALKKEWIQEFLRQSNGENSAEFISLMNGEYRSILGDQFENKGNMYDVFYAMIDHFNEYKIWSGKRYNVYNGAGEVINTTNNPGLLYNFTHTDMLEKK